MHKGDYVPHKQPNYHLIFALLMVILAVSIFIGTLTVPLVPVILIFSFAIAKAYLVLAYFMHLRYQPLYCTLILAVALLALYCMFLGVIPDMIFPPVD
ncbi:MAG: hypothetical protein CL908_23785 [Deltaproteobacteria bacterium]|nr:hypothetical protein [Deltaproteobacteria bacterium]